MSAPDTASTTFGSPQRGSGARAAWFTVGAIFAVAALGWTTLTIVDVLAHESEEERLVFDAPVRVIELDVDSGSVEIEGTDDTRTIVEADISIGLDAPDRTEVLEGDRLVIRADCRPVLATWCGVDYRILVPRATAIVADSSGGGITVRGVAGDLDLDSSGGGVHIADASGSLRVRSSGGGVRATGLRSPVVDARSSGGGVRLEFSASPRAVDARSSGGGVTIVVPDDDVAYRVDASSSGGSTRSEVRQDPTSERVIVARSSGGGVRVTYPTFD